MLGFNSEFEVQKIVTFLENFGWTLVKQEISENKVVVTIQKLKESSLDKVDVGAS